MLAAKYAHETVVRLLLEHGAIATGQSYDTPLISVVIGRHFAVVRVPGETVRANPLGDMASLWWKLDIATAPAATQGNLQALQCLFEIWTVLSSTEVDENGHAISPPQDLYEHLLQAAESGYVKFVRLLLAHGVDLDERIYENENLVTIQFIWLLQKGT